MKKGEPSRGVRGVSARNSILDSGDGVSCVELPVVCVKVGVDDMVSAEGAQAISVAVEIRGAHVGWALSDDVVKSIVEGGHLSLNSGSGKSVKIGMGPGVGTKLMTFVYDALDNGGLA